MTRLTPGCRLAVIGAGTMGTGIAAISVASGFHVALVDTDDQAVRAAARRTAGRIDRLSHNPEVTAGELTATTDLRAAVSDARMVIEAIPEVVELKRALFESLVRMTDADTVLASNTSTMSIADLAAVADSQSPRVVGMHFFNPAHRMALVEVITAPTTAPETLEAALDLCRHLGKEPIVVRDTPGFVTSRLGLLLGNEAMRIVEEGVASAADVDAAMRLGYNHPMGPLELADLVGLDARLNNLRSVADRMGRTEFEPPAILVDLVATGRLGRKTGEGFYKYEDGEDRVQGDRS